MVILTSTLRDRLTLLPAPALDVDAAAAAVAAVLRDGATGAEILFIKRAEREGDPWSGHLAFPGGKREPSDASLFSTAVRETEEEVGLRLPTAAARLSDVAARSNGYRVAQFVFALDEPQVALVTNAEVAATLWVPLERLASGEGAGTMKYPYQGMELTLPCVRLGEYVLWGMTYRMVRQLLEATGLAAAAAG
jgi:8-oxo-dGTP pyrophosphatase MutT (NUDIX family)